jgi:hypothetical protein
MSGSAREILVAMKSAGETAKAGKTKTAHTPQEEALMRQYIVLTKAEVELLEDACRKEGIISKEGVLTTGYLSNWVKTLFASALGIDFGKAPEVLTRPR